MNVTLSFILDEADPTPGPFDNHSLAVGMDGLGTLTFHGEGGGSAVGDMDGSAAGGIWDNFQAAANEPESGKSSDDMITYALPELMDGLALNTSYTPGGTGFGGESSSVSYSATYTGVEGLTIAYGTGEDNSTAVEADATAWKVAYAYGPITVTATDLEYDHGTSTSDRNMDSQAVSYTISDELSITYGVEEITDGSASSEKAEFESISASYTSGGMTLTVSSQEGKNIDYSTTATQDQERWAISAAFAF